MGTPRRPRQPRNQSSSNNNSRQPRNQPSDDGEGAVHLSIEAERTIGSLGGIRTDATATVGIDAFTRNNRVTGFIDPANRSAGLGMGIGSAKKKMGGEVELNVQLNENGSINSIGGNIAGSVVGFGGGIGVSSAGDARISGQGFGIGVEIARDKEGNVTLQTCFGIGIIEACTTFSRDKGDPQNTEGTLKLPRLDFGAASKPARPKKPNAPGGNPTRKKPQPKAPKADTPKPNPRPQPDQPDKIRTDKKPQLDTKKKPVGFGKKPTAPIKRPGNNPKKKPTINPKKKPTIDLRKKPAIDLGKKPTIDLRKKPAINIRKSPSIDLGKKSPINLKKPIDPSPINLKKPIPAPLTPKLPRPTPTPTPTPPKLPKPSPAPKPTPPPKPPRPSPWPSPSPSPSPSPNDKNIGFPSPIITPLLEDKKCYHVVILWHAHTSYRFVWEPDPNVFVRASIATETHGGGVWINNQIRFYAIVDEYLPYAKSPAFIESHTPPTATAPGTYKGNFKAWALLNNSLQIVIPGGYLYNEQLLAPWYIEGRGEYIKEYILTWKPPSHIWDLSVYEISCNLSSPTPGLPRRIVPKSVFPSPSAKSPRLPNKPTKIKPMDCCKELKEIHKYLGIAKMKKDKFKVAKAFMVAGGTGNQECEDYYQVTQSLFRMLANGLIINPISKPLGNEWQNVNATTWAAQVYEMVAESMSDGNSSQKFEIAAIMQLAQLMSTIAELTRKVEFLADAIGYEPILDTEDVPIAFTIHESHKGFAKYQPIKIDISKAKSDDDVEAVLAKMLQPSKIPIVSWRFRPSDVSINKTLRAL